MYICTYIPFQTEPPVPKTMPKLQCAVLRNIQGGLPKFSLKLVFVCFSSSLYCWPDRCIIRSCQSLYFYIKTYRALLRAGGGVFWGRGARHGRLFGVLGRQFKIILGVGAHRHLGSGSVGGVAGASRQLLGHHH